VRFLREPRPVTPSPPVGALFILAPWLAAYRKVAAMTLNDLKTGLGILKPGQMLSMSYAVYELIFPPGEPDELARTRAWALVEEYGCTIKNLPSEKRVLFLKPKLPTSA
jgi:hypothetical protein